MKWRRKKVKTDYEFTPYVIEEDAVVYPDYKYVLDRIKEMDVKTRIVIGFLLQL